MPSNSSLHTNAQLGAELDELLDDTINELLLDVATSLDELAINELLRNTITSFDEALEDASLVKLLEDTTNELLLAVIITLDKLLEDTIRELLLDTVASLDAANEDAGVEDAGELEELLFPPPEPPPQLIKLTKAIPRQSCVSTGLKPCA
ncbi:MAG: hypothetical protein K0Q78_2361 [Cellvibrio sp.]|nr:hypothetical protein [Cellvibrio sp.]